MAIESRPRIRLRKLSGLRLGSLLNKGIWGLCDQGLISGTNFLTTVILARNLSPTDFGAFVLLYGVVYSTISLQTTLVSRPHNVIGVTRHGEDYRRYTTVTAVSQLCFTALFALLSSMAAIVAHRAGWWVAPLFTGLIPAVAAWQLQEFTRRVLYTEVRLRDAFMNDLISYGGQAVTIVALGFSGLLTGVGAFVIIAISSGLGAAFGCWQIRKSLSRRGIRGAIREEGFAENWRFGRWLFGAALATWVSSQVYPLMIGAFISVAEAGAFGAVYTLTGPVRVLLIAMDTALAAVAARAFTERGQPGLQLFIRRIFVLTAPVIIVYTVLVSVFASRILVLIFGARFRPYGWLLMLFALSYALDYLRLPVSIALEARRTSAPIFRAYLVSAIVVLTAGFAAIRFLGLLGAALGTMANSVILGAMLWSYYRGVVTADAAETAIAPAWEGARGG